MLNLLTALLIQVKIVILKEKKFIYLMNRKRKKRNNSIGKVNKQITKSYLPLIYTINNIDSSFVIWYIYLGHQHTYYKTLHLKNLVTYSQNLSLHFK